jgi:hypothetical protein
MADMKVNATWKNEERRRDSRQGIVRIWAQPFEAQGKHPAPPFRRNS